MKNTHGGKRAGAGRKPKHGTPKTMIAVAVTHPVKTYLQSTGNASEAVEQLVRRSKAFRKSVN